MPLQSRSTKKQPHTYRRWSGGSGTSTAARSPRTGFDCSGLTQYVYRHYGKSIPRTADGQFLHFRRESRSRAWGGDLVFFHENSSPNSSVYHVGIYEGSNHMVSAANASEGIRWQTIWSSDVTFGTITH